MNLETLIILDTFGKGTISIWRIIRVTVSDIIIIIVGITALLSFSYFLFKDKKIFRFLLLGMLCGSCSSFIGYIILKYYPESVLYIFPFILVTKIFAIVFTGIGIFYMTRSFLKRYR